MRMAGRREDVRGPLHKSLPFAYWSAQASDSFHKSVDPSRGVLAFTASRSLPLIEFACPSQCVVTKRMQPGARQLLLVIRHVPFAFVVERAPLYVGALIAKMQQSPQFKTGIGNRQLYPVGAGLLLCFRRSEEHTSEVQSLRHL